MTTRVTFKGDVGQTLSGSYAGWYTILCTNGTGIEIQIHPKVAKKLGIEDIGQLNFRLEVTR